MRKYISALYVFYLFCTLTSYSDAHTNNSDENNLKSSFSSKIEFEMWNALSEQKNNSTTYSNTCIITGKLKYQEKLSENLKYILGMEGMIYTPWSKVMEDMPILQDIYGILEHDITSDAYQKLIISMKTDRSIDPLKYQSVGFRTYGIRYLPIALLQQKLGDDINANIKPYSSFLSEQPLYKNTQSFANKVSLVGVYNDFTVGLTYVPDTSEYFGKFSTPEHITSNILQRYKNNVRALTSYSGKFQNIDFIAWYGGESAYFEENDNNCGSIVYGIKVGYMGTQLSLAGASFNNITKSLKGEENSTYLGISYGISKFRVGFISDTFFGEEYISNKMGLFEIHYDKHIAILFGVAKTQYKENSQNLVICNLTGVF
ncbi:hypothetical protein [Candidatus Fokinia crypta]|uniref:Porin n=1 Tax=Candidatus Fokinia crypta TaxID=1920990 RepID=A0ABZ0UUA5_9RICK|nr:hypothetical protein [Candidatus Fokinia cryptica]WPX97655.1 hypothetical protein Fokcrypt_00164 [Candidatus Fokinia cryptica]